MEHAISIRGLTKRYGRHTAVDDVSYDVAEGAVCALLGQNGAGKTTTIRTMLDLLRPTDGRIEVLGMDSVRDSVEIRSRVGYLPEEPTYYPWMTVREILAFNGRFFSNWDADLCDRLLDRLSLPRERRLRDLSRGMQAKVGLVMAMAQRPELLLLDDPTSGLDPVVRRQFLEAMIDNVQAEGGTVFFSTHLVHEIERVADEVVIMHGGRLLLHEPVEELKSSRRRLRAVFPDPMPDADIPGLELVEQTGHHAIFTTRRYGRETVHSLRERGFTDVEVFDMDLEEIFVQEVSRRGGPDPEPGESVPSPDTREAAA